ncbi:isoprenyl transferase [Legionella sp. km772]|uniref:isoprenyl transferase n=1 Tax=Legionella sp. km772 TaxID=2498111 RepID=UPI000F8D908E|nr:isoprenyl transferase [Legionella sp. km772]RUR13646.1 isoprenyl transferase [Legionella sp. km772]
MDYKIPKHIAIVMDGNGRWAESRGLPRIEGHKAGVESVRAMIRTCLEKKIPYLSLFAFSSENWQRPTDEVNFLMELFIEALKNELDALNENEVQMRFTGDRTRLSPLLQQQMTESEEVTKNNQKLTLNIVVNYGGKWDVLTAAKKMTQAVLNGELVLNELNEEQFSLFLDTKELPEPDLFIRTSGELRISNFFLWQLAYTELYFTEVHWPDFNQKELELALESFGKRKRRFGQVSTF